MSRYEGMFRRLKAEGAGAFVPFVVLGDPDLQSSRRIIETLIVSGADCLELGIPFSDPIADGPTIQTATVRALAGGVTPSDCWQLLREVRAAHPALPLGLLVYSNLVVHDGMHRFYGEASDAGVDSVLVADVPSMEMDPFVTAATAEGIEPVLIAPPNASDARLEQIARVSRGYTYVVTRAGVTGAEQVALGQADLLRRLAAMGAAPPLVGFGISRPAQVRAALDMGAAGAISGSAVVSRVTDHLGDLGATLDALAAFVTEMKAATRGVPQISG